MPGTKRTLGLSALPPGALAGVTCFAQGLVFAPGAPNGIHTITNVQPPAFR